MTPEEMVAQITALFELVAGQIEALKQRVDDLERRVIASGMQ